MGWVCGAGFVTGSSLMGLDGARYARVGTCYIYHNELKEPPQSYESKPETENTEDVSLTPRYLLYRALGALVTYIVGTWEFRVWFFFLPGCSVGGEAKSRILTAACELELRRFNAWGVGFHPVGITILT